MFFLQTHDVLNSLALQCGWIPDQRAKPSDLDLFLDWSCYQIRHLSNHFCREAEQCCMNDSHIDTLGSVKIATDSAVTPQTVRRFTHD